MGSAGVFDPLGAVHIYARLSVRGFAGSPAVIE